MPPKGGSRGASRQALPERGRGRKGFSIASFFDAASAHRGGGGGSGGGGYGFRIAPPENLNAGQSHYNSSSHSREETAAPAPANAYSSVLQDVRQRIMTELEELGPSSGSREGLAKLKEHHQRVLSIAFGAPNGTASESTPNHRHSRSGTVGGGGGSSSYNENENSDDELLVSTVEFSLSCPYSRLPVRCPVRSRDCRHVQCCDLDSWMVLLDKYRSLRDPKGPCPVCEQRVAASSLEVDLWMLTVIANMPSGTHLVALDADGNYRNADAARERKREEVVMEVVDGTQEDYENYLGDVVVDDDDGVGGAVSVAAGSSISGVLGKKRPRSMVEEAYTIVSNGASLDGPMPAPPLLSHTPTPSLSSGGSMMSVKLENALASAALQEGQGRLEGTEEEEAGLVSDHGVQASQVPSSQGDSGVVVVHYVEGRQGRALPSQVRLWVLHCTQCGATLLKGEDGAVSGSCEQCGQTTREQWTLIRRFEQSPGVSIELTPDDTVILHGMDVASAYLFRAGFQRTLFLRDEYAPRPSASLTTAAHAYRRPARGIWVTTMPLSRFEIDFLEACCQRVACGASLDDFDGMMIPPLFRIPRRRAATTQSWHNTQFQTQHSSNSRVVLTPH